MAQYTPEKERRIQRGSLRGFGEAPGGKELVSNIGSVAQEIVAQTPLGGILDVGDDPQSVQGLGSIGQEAYDTFNFLPGVRLGAQAVDFLNEAGDMGNPILARNKERLARAQQNIPMGDRQPGQYALSDQDLAEQQRRLDQGLDLDTGLPLRQTRLDSIRQIQQDRAGGVDPRIGNEQIGTGQFGENVFEGVQEETAPPVRRSPDEIEADLLERDRQFREQQRSLRDQERARIEQEMEPGTVQETEFLSEPRRRMNERNEARRRRREGTPEPAVAPDIQVSDAGVASYNLVDPTGSGRTAAIGATENPNAPGSYTPAYDAQRSGSEYGEAAMASPRFREDVSGLAAIAISSGMDNPLYEELNKADAALDLDRSNFPSGPGGDTQYNKALEQARRHYGNIAKRVLKTQGDVFKRQGQSQFEDTKAKEQRIERVNRATDAIMQSSSRDPFRPSVSREEAVRMAIQQVGQDDEQARLVSSMLELEGQRGDIFGQAGYDYETARLNNLERDPVDGHYPSRVPSGPDEGLILKDESHPTFGLTVAGEQQAGMSFYTATTGPRKGRTFSFPHGTEKPGFVRRSFGRSQTPQSVQNIQPQQIPQIIQMMDQYDLGYSVTQSNQGIPLITSMGQQFRAVISAASPVPVALVTNELEEQRAKSAGVPYVTSGNINEVKNPVKLKPQKEPSRVAATGGRKDFGTDAIDEQALQVEAIEQAEVDFEKAYKTLVAEKSGSEGLTTRREDYYRLAKKYLEETGEETDPNVNPVLDKDPGFAAWLEQRELLGDTDSMEIMERSNIQDGMLPQITEPTDDPQVARLREIFDRQDTRKNRRTGAPPSAASLREEYIRPRVNEIFQNTLESRIEQQRIFDDVSGRSQQEAVKNAYTQPRNYGNRLEVTLQRTPGAYNPRPVRVRADGSVEIDTVEQVVDTAMGLPFFYQGRPITLNRQRLEDATEDIIRRPGIETTSSRGIYDTAVVEVAEIIQQAFPNEFPANNVGLTRLTEISKNMLRRLGYLTENDLLGY
tara:strand:- start:938 stop:3985 length:3048 start_codon:yes stop_codon:yes gene_type:complete